MKSKLRQPSIIALTTLLLFGLFVGVVVGSYFTSNKSELLDAMSSTSRSRLVKDTEQLNKLISYLEKTESVASDKPASNRQEISKLYLSLADILADDLRNIQIRNPTMTANTKITIDNLRGLSSDIMKEGIYPSPFQPQNIR